MTRTVQTRWTSLRRASARSCVVLLLTCAAYASAGQAQNTYPAPPADRMPQPSNPQPPHSPQNPYVTQPRAIEPRGHLAEWMQAHRNLTPDQQQRALDAEPGFRQLQPEVQQRMHERLSQLNTMSPEQRQRAISRTEWMEHLSVPQRMQVRTALSDLGALPKDRRMAVARTFHMLETLPPNQRVAFLNGPQARAELSGQEITVLGNLLSAGPYLPPRPEPPTQ